MQMTKQEADDDDLERAFSEVSSFHYDNLSPSVLKLGP